MYMHLLSVAVDLKGDCGIAVYLNASQGPCRKHYIASGIDSR